MTIIELAQTILEQEGKELNFREIAKKAMILDKSLGDDEEACAKKFGQALTSHINKNDKKTTSIFKRISNGKGGFKSGMYGLKKKIQPKPPVPSLDTPVATTFTGKAVEYGVFSELLYWGYNPAMMVVDHGVDIVASINGEYFHIQVKTANPNANKSFNYKISKDIFEAHENSKTFYVFVVRRDVKGRPISDYIIMQSSLIRQLIDRNIVTNGKDISFSIGIDNNIFKVNGHYQITGVNDFSRIR
ncbi:MAG: HTH domain-containing protein [Methylobacter sp.]|nr:HTH domain-containing protein [Methylobacter sp.]